MKICISDRPASSLLKLAITARVASGVIIDLPGLYNSGWISILLGFLLATAPLWAAVQCMRAKVQLSKPAFFVLLLLFLFDSASVACMLADSASYMALNSTYSAYLLLPMFLLCLACLRLNGDAIGSSASLWNRILPWMGLFVILIQFRDYEPEWLSPVLGPGISEITDGAVKTAGWLTLPSMIFLIIPSDSDNRAQRPFRTMLTAAACASGIAVIFSMMTPSIMDSTLFSHAFRLDALLANGRTSLALQLPSITLWYIGLFYALLFNVFAAALLMQKCLPRWNRHACTLSTLTIAFIFAASGLAERSASLQLAGWYFILCCVTIAASMIVHLFRKGAAGHA